MNACCVLTGLKEATTFIIIITITLDLIRQFVPFKSFSDLFPHVTRVSLDKGACKRDRALFQLLLVRT